MAPCAEKIWKEGPDSRKTQCGCSQKVCDRRGQGLEERLAHVPTVSDLTVSGRGEQAGSIRKERRH